MVHYRVGVTYCFVIALWGAIVGGMVLGKIIEQTEPPKTEVLESHPGITQAQVKQWGQEFFDRTTNYRKPSRTEVLEEFPRFKDAREMVESKLKYSYSVDRQTHNRRYYDLNLNNPFKPKIKGENLEWMLQNIFMYPRNHNTNESAKEVAKKYIIDSLQLTSGLQTSVQYFEPIQFLEMYEGSRIPQGANIVGVLKGKEWGTPNDKPILVGAHWDTVNFTPGTDDNGSGVAAMLESARTMSHSGCRPKNSIFFVAFDLEEVGSQGSLIFIKEYLMEVMKTNLPLQQSLGRFQGAFIMDTIMDFNDTEGSQTFPKDWSLVVPEVYDQVADNNYKGDFLSMIYRKTADIELARKFNHHWDKSTHSPEFKLLPFPLSLGKDLPSMDILADHLNFLRSDHSRFWYMNDSRVPESLQAVLMTDTGPYRGNMRHCYHTVCDGPELSVYNNPTNLRFLAKVTQVLTDTILDMADCGSSQPVPHNFIKTPAVHAKSSSSSNRNASPISHLLNFVKWMENSYQ